MMMNKGFDFVYSTDIALLEDVRFAHCCFHIICLGGDGSFVYNEKCFYMSRNDIIVISHPNEVANIACTADFCVECFAADYQFLRNALPPNNYSIRGSMSLYQDPVIPLSEANSVKFIGDIHRLRDRLSDSGSIYYHEIMASLCLTLMYDIFEFHAAYYRNRADIDRANYVVNEFQIGRASCRERV